MSPRSLLILAVLISIFTVFSVNAEDSKNACILNLLRDRRDTYFPEDRIPVSQIRYRIYGEQNQETIVLVHGLGGSLESWNKVAPALAKKFKVLVYDQRGHGGTPEKGHNFSSTMLAHDLKSLLDSLGIQSAHLLGHSMGGRTVMKFGSLFPEGTRSVMIEDMHFLGRSKPLPDKTLLTLQLEKLKTLRFKSSGDAVETAEDLLGPLSMGDLERLGLRREGTDYFFSRINPNVPLYSAQGLQEDLTSAVKSVQTSILLMAADSDRDAVLFGKGLEHIREIRSDAKVVTFHGASHGIHGDQPARFVSTVLDFIKGLRP